MSSFTKSVVEIIFSMEPARRPFRELHIFLHLGIDIFKLCRQSLVPSMENRFVVLCTTQMKGSWDHFGSLRMCKNKKPSCTVPGGCSVVTFHFCFSKALPFTTQHLIYFKMRVETS